MQGLLGLSKTIDKLNSAVGWLMMWVIFASTVISCLNAVVRKAFDIGSNAFLEVQWYLFATSFLLAAGYTLLNNEHVRIDVVSGRFSKRGQIWIDIIGFLLFAMRGRSLVPTRIQSLAEMLYEYVNNIVTENLGEDGKRYFPWVFTIFIFILALNLLGMIPGNFTVTSHIIVTFGLAAMVWTIVTLIGFWNHGFGFLRL